MRELEHKDVNNAASFLALVCDEMDFHLFGHNFHLKSVTDNLHLFVDREDVFVFLYEEKDELVGMYGMMLVPSLVNRNEMSAIEFIWHAKPGLSRYKRAKIFIKLLNYMEIWSNEIGVKRITVNVSPYGDSKNAAKLLIKRGFKMFEVNYVKGVT